MSPGHARPLAARNDFATRPSTMMARRGANGAAPEKENMYRAVQIKMRALKDKRGWPDRRRRGRRPCLRGRLRM